MHIERYPRYILIDFDRTLANVDILHDILEDVVAEETGVSTDFLREARETAELQGKSFDTIEYVRHNVAQAESNAWNAILASFTRKVAHRTDTLEPYAAEFLHELQQRAIPFGIITYGLHEWQSTKLHAVGLGSVPHYITPKQQKGELLTTWQNKDGSFTLPDDLSLTSERHTYETLAFIDDKPISFIGIPVEVTAILVHPLASKPVDQGDAVLPEQVRVANGLKEVQALLF